MTTWTKDSLERHLDGGATVEFLFFWGHTPKKPPAVDQSCLSQWFPRVFTLDGVSYASAEHFMMAEKARLFADDASLKKILAAETPEDAKVLGRGVAGYDDAKWSAARYASVVRGNVAKFGGHADLRAFLLGTGEKLLVEASPRDRIWGIGLGASNPLARHPKTWRGENLLGFALMEARAALSSSRAFRESGPEGAKA
jgi:ribA/ribD-fused uncharacterized protein